MNQLPTADQIFVARDAVLRMSEMIQPEQAQDREESRVRSTRVCSLNFVRSDPNGLTLS